MPAPRPSEQAGILRSTLLCIAALLISNAATAAAGNEQLAEAGRRIYVDGILPDGSPLTAIRFAGASAVSGGEAACVTCHRNSGYGSVEGRILVPPIAGAVLFSPGVFHSAAPGARQRGTHAVVSAAERFRTRSAYDEAALGRTLRNGTDPDGIPLRPPMARYRLDAGATKALAAYLRKLSDGPDPGIAGDTLHLGTVITPDVPPAERDALLEVLRGYAATRKDWDMHWQLHVWQLTGAPQEWEAQLEAFYRQQPVFALLSGAGKVEWQPAHRFCERRAVACILPSLELPPESVPGHYSFYFSPGLALEARLLVQQLASNPSPPERLIQVVADAAGKRAAMVVQRALQDAGSSITVQQASPEEYASMQPLAAQDAVAWWLRPDRVARLAASIHETPPAALYLSALLAPPETLAMPVGWKQSVHYVSMFDPLASRRTQTTLVPWLVRQGIAANELRLRADVFAACNFFSSAISAMQLQTAHGVRGPLTRERLFETLESNLTIYRDDNAPYYWQLSLGPSQRTLVKGGMLLGYTGSDSEEWMPLTARIVP